MTRGEALVRFRSLLDRYAPGGLEEWPAFVDAIECRSVAKDRSLCQPGHACGGWFRKHRYQPSGDVTVAFKPKEAEYSPRLRENAADR